MRKFLFILLAISIGFNIYQYKEERVVTDTFEAEIIQADQVKVAQSAIKAKCEPQEKIVYKCPEKITSTKTQSIPTVERSSLSYDRFFQNWNNKRTEFLEYELRLSEDKLQRFSELLELRNQEVNDTLADKVQENDHANANGEEYSYFLQADDMVALGKINLKYKDELEKLLGKDDFEQYLQYRARYNKAFGDTQNYIDF